jgi:hypothetical protein
LTAVAELLWVAKSCLARVANTAWGALGNQTKSEYARADRSLAELMRLVDNAKDKCKEGGAK